MLPSRKTHRLFFLLSISFLLLFSCSDESTETTPSDEKLNWDKSCTLNKVYILNPSETDVEFLDIVDGYNADTLLCFDYDDSVYINSYSFLYDDLDRQIVRKKYTIERILEKTVYQEYWPNGKPKKTTTEVADLDDLYNSYNAKQIWLYNEEGDAIEYKNLNESGTIMNHHIYTNKYEDGRLVETLRDDIKYNYDGKVEYKYNDDGQLVEQITTDLDGGNAIRETNEYDANGNLASQKVHKGDSFSNWIGYKSWSYNDNGVLLAYSKNVPDDSGEVKYTFYYEYKCE